MIHIVGTDNNGNITLTMAELEKLLNEAKAEGKAEAEKETQPRHEISFNDIQMLRRIVENVTPKWMDKHCNTCCYFNDYDECCGYHKVQTTEQGCCNKWESDTDG